ncbi:hypothetical protein FVEN_g12819 [Fusarium venenatum]|nr:hypothetical protein FVEN_g12819 [Fusarium venenatum]
MPESAAVNQFNKKVDHQQSQQQGQQQEAHIEG